MSSCARHCGERVRLRWPGRGSSPMRWEAGATRRRIVTAVASVVLLSLTGCVSPAHDSAGYRNKVGHAAEKMAGIIGSAQLAAEQQLAGKSFGTFADQV